MIFFAVTLITLTHVITNSAPGCAIAAPAPSLPASLRALGGFDQSFDAGQPPALAQVGAERGRRGEPEPRRRDTPGTGARGRRRRRAARGGGGAARRPGRRRAAATRLVGLVSFYVGCGGRAYFGSVAEISRTGSGAPASFPAVGESAAAAQLATSTPQLVYTGSPFTPEWRNAQSGATIPAGE